MNSSPSLADGRQALGYQRINLTRGKRNNSVTGGAASNRRSTHATPRSAVRNTISIVSTPPMRGNDSCSSTKRVSFAMNALKNATRRSDSRVDQSDRVEWACNYRIFCERDNQSVVSAIVVFASGVMTTSKYWHTYASLMRGRFLAASVWFWVWFAKPLKNTLAVQAVSAGPSC